NTPSPSQIGLKVDGLPVTNTGGSNGSYVSSATKVHSGSSCSYHISSAWTDFPYFSGASVTYSVNQGYTVKQGISPSLAYQLDPARQVVKWNTSASVNFPGSASSNSQAVEFDLPLNWNVTQIVNTTNQIFDPWVPGKIFGNTTIMTKTYNLTTIWNASSGSWLLNAESPLQAFPTTINSTAIGQYIFANISDTLLLQGSVPNGPNGVYSLQRTDTGGGVTSVTTLNGSIAGSPTVAPVSSSNPFILVTNPTGNVQQSVVNLNFSLSNTAGVLQHLLNQISLTMDQFTYNLSTDTKPALAMWTEKSPSPSLNPLDQTYGIDGYCNALMAHVYPNFISNVSFNFTANWLNSVKPANITGLRISIAHNLTADYLNLQETLWAKNFTSGKMEQLDPSCLSVYNYWNTTTYFRDVVWDSTLNSSVNITSYIDPSSNNVTCALNMSSFQTLKGSGNDGFIGIDYLNLAYNFTNPVGYRNFTVAFFNQTAHAFSPAQYLPISSQFNSTTITLLGNASDFYNVAANNLQIQFNLTHWSPTQTAAFFDVLYLSFNYTQVQSLTWQQTILNTFEQVPPTYNQAIVTYNNAMANNITFNWNISSTTQTPGNYTWITLMSNGTQIAVNTTDIFIRGLPTAIEPVSGVAWDGQKWVTNPSPFVNDTTKSILVLVNDTVFGVNLTSVTIQTLGWSTGQLTVINEYATTGLDVNRGFYSVLLNTTGLAASASGYVLNLTVSSPIYLSSSVNVTVVVDPLPTLLTTAQTQYTVWENETLQLGVGFTDTFHQALITGGSLAWQIVGGTASQQGTFSQILNDYNTAIDTQANCIMPGTYTLAITGQLTNFQTATTSVSFIILAKNRTTLTVDDSALSDNILEGSTITVSSILKYQGNNSAVAGADIVFTFDLTAQSGSTSVTVKSSSDNQGIASVNFQVPIGTTSLAVSAQYGGTISTAKSQGAGSKTFTVITATQQLINVLISLSPYIIGAIIVIVVISLYSRSRHKKLERFWDTRVSKLRDVMNIQHVLVIHKNSGTALVSQNYGGEKIDGNLISGFLTALTSFQSEIAVKKGEVSGKKGFTLDYADFKILLEDGEFIRASLILEAEASDEIKETLVRFIQRYESRFQKELKEWNGNLKAIEGGANLIEEVFEMSLIYPHTVNPGINKKKLPYLERAIYEMGQAITKERPFFFIATLLEYAIAGRKESKDHIFSVIYDMKKTHVLEPMNVDNAG
ncbi:MAG TPA: hypothetical protein VKK79_02460, partial [Candidatus Lokiarchaeia archaeon]|nr:hypothetical protein [Candidatus Lokiarchaeia archaeon]